MTSGGWGAFVVACMPLIRAEAESLARGGAPIEVDDAVQEVATQMLAANGRADLENNARDFIRFRLRNFLRDTRRANRIAKKSVEIDNAAPADRGVDGVLEKSEHNAMTVESHEEDVIRQVDGVKLLDLWPVSKGGRQAQDEMDERWLPRFKDFANRGAA